MTEGTGTFGLTVVELEDKHQINQLKDIKEKPNHKPPIRQKLTQDKLQIEKTKQQQQQQKLPTITRTVRSQSTQQFRIKKIDQLKQIIDINKPQVIGNVKEHPMPKSSKSFLDIYQNKIKTEFNQLYSTSDYTQIMNQIKTIEKKQVMVEQIERNQTFLQQQMKLYNDIENQVKVQEKKYSNLQLQLEGVEKQLERPDNMNEYEQKSQFHQQLCNEIDELAFYSETLQNMKSFREGLINFEKKQCQKLYRQSEKLYQDIQLNFHLYKELYDSEKVDKLGLEIEKLRDQGFNYQQMHLPETFENQFDDQLSEYENKKTIDQILKHEDQQKIVREKRLKIERIADEKRILEENEKMYQEIQNDIKQVDKQLNIEKQNFETLKQVTQVNSIGNLITHKKYLDEGKQGLENIKKEYQADIDKNKNLIIELSNRRKTLLYEQQTNLQEDSMLNKVTQIEKECRVIAEHQKEVQEVVQKKRSSINQMCLLVSRILYQLQSKKEKIKNIEVKLEDLIEMINVSSLMLERINGLLQKHQGDYLKVESVNTDTTQEIPPQYLGLAYFKPVGKGKVGNENANSQNQSPRGAPSLDASTVNELRNQIKAQNDPKKIK